MCDNTLVISWDRVPPEYTYAAMDGDGQVYLYTARPTIPHGSSMWSNSNNGKYKYKKANTVAIMSRPNLCDWQHSLVGRSVSRDLQIDWSQYPEFKYAARDANGVVCVFSAVPIAHSSSWGCTEGGYKFVGISDVIDAGTKPWRKSLIVAPISKKCAQNETIAHLKQKIKEGEEAQRKLEEYKKQEHIQRLVDEIEDSFGARIKQHGGIVTIKFGPTQYIIR